MDKLKMHTPDLVDKNIEKIAELFPNTATEVIKGYREDGTAIVGHAIDFDVLRQELSDVEVEGNQERYQFTWPDKRKSILLANAPIAKTLRPCREKSVDFDNTENIYIEGDNLDALKLLQETYLGKVKIIYIDPPYNTGNDFVYNDDFSESTDDYLDNSGQFDDDGNRMVQNTNSNGRFHTDWLNMLYPRLKLAKDLLGDTGVIFISIDEHEIDNMLKISDEVYGRDNRIGVIVVKSNPRGSMSTAEIASLHEYLVIYAKNIHSANIVGHPLTGNMANEYKYQDENGKYRLLGLRMRGGFWRRTERPNLYFPIYINPDTNQVSLEQSKEYNAISLPIQPSTMEDGTWRWSREKIINNSNQLIGKIINRNNEIVWDVYQKDYLGRGGIRRTKAKSIWDESEINYQNGTNEMKNLFNKTGVFDYSKPVFLIERIIDMVDVCDDDIILDFFSGSATTAHAVMQLNAEDGGHRKFIMVQLPEETDEKSEAYKAGYKDICAIGEERIRRAGKKIKEESPLTTAALDTGFRVFKVDSTNMKDVYYTPVAYKQDQIKMFADNIKEDRTPEDLLFQVMLDLGILLSSKIEEKTINNQKVFSVADGYLIACFENNVTDETVKEIAKQKPYYAVFRDSGMANDNVTTNFEQIFKTNSPTTVRKVL